MPAWSVSPRICAPGSAASRVFLHVCMYVCMYMYVCICMYVYVCMYIYIYIYRYIAPNRNLALGPHKTSPPPTFFYLNLPGASHLTLG